MVMEVHALVNGSLIGYILGVQEKWLWFGRGGDGDPAQALGGVPDAGGGLRLHSRLVFLWILVASQEQRCAKALVPALRNLIAQCPQ